jgi:integrase/recombinase XerD
MSYGNALTIWKPARKIFSHFTQSESDAIIAATKEPKYRYCFETLRGTGLRIGEVLALKVKDLIPTRDGPVLMIVREKKGIHTKVERLPIAADLGDRLELYYKAAGLKSNDKLFDGHDNSYRYQLRESAKRAGIPNADNVHPHMFRHSFVYGQVAIGTHPLVLSALVGHSSLQVTQGYYGPQESDLRRAMEAKA